MNRQASHQPRGLCRIDATAIADHRKIIAGPVSMLLERTGGGWRVLAFGKREAVGHHPGSARAIVIDRPGAVLIPGLVNAHTHLDLTHVGPLQYDPEADFLGWIKHVIARRLDDPDAIARSVRRGVELSLAGGSVAVGDIAGCPASGPTLVPFGELVASPLIGTSYLEYFAIGTGEAKSLDRLDGFLAAHMDELESRDGVRFGIQPHAPYTVGMGGYEKAVALGDAHGWALCTHAAESPGEHVFIEEGTGPARELLEHFGLWDDAVVRSIGHGSTPIEFLEPVLRAKPWLLAHVNDADDATIRTLADVGASVVYCPRSSAYFGAQKPFGAHRYREMLGAGINVCLGTDSIINLPEEATDPRRAGISVLDEMRLLWRRDGTDARLLLEMATVNGARALGIDPGLFEFDVGSTMAGVLSIEIDHAGASDPVRALLASSSRPELLTRAGISGEQE